MIKTMTVDKAIKNQFVLFKLSQKCFEKKGKSLRLSNVNVLTTETLVYFPLCLFKII